MSRDPRSAKGCMIHSAGGKKKKKKETPKAFRVEWMPRRWKVLQLKRLIGGKFLSFIKRDKCKNKVSVPAD